MNSVVDIPYSSHACKYKVTVSIYCNIGYIYTYCMRFFRENCTNITNNNTFAEILGNIGQPKVVK